jgi:hypothetical protein
LPGSNETVAHFQLKQAGQQLCVVDIRTAILSALRPGETQLQVAFHFRRDFARAPTQIGFGNLGVATSPAHKVKLKIISTGRNDMGYDGIVGVRALRASHIRFNFGEMTVSWK